MKSIIIIGHKNPDTDSVVASLVFAEFLKKVKEPIIGFRDFKIRVGRGGKLNKETEFVLNHFKQKKPALIKSLKNKEVFLVDHGDYTEAVEGIAKANILGVLDHHKLGGIKTILPVFYRAEPMGSSSSIVAKMFFENNLSLTKKTAGLLLAGILSDTLKFTSPTTTKKDKEIARILAKISKENINRLAKQLFEKKSDISGISPNELVSKDYKEYKEGKTSFGFGVWETISPKKNRRNERKDFLCFREVKKEKKTGFSLFCPSRYFREKKQSISFGRKRKISS